MVRQLFYGRLPHVYRILFEVMEDEKTVSFFTFATPRGVPQRISEVRSQIF